ncbi:MAG TPA: NUDIX hydrolase [Candidatus Baltobacteraceae bacterium]|jgi:8-oxo-dGTP diphosphatase|nr:NUDIX hydrolase [Candidatus Baltobacteraceae bacterium]
MEFPGEDELLAQADADRIRKFVVGAFIQRDDGAILVLKRRDDDFMGGLFEIPSGGVDDGESLAGALEREVFEETGLRLTSIGTFVNFFDYTDETGAKARQWNFYVLVSETNDVRISEEHSDFGWWTPDTPVFAMSDQVGKLVRDFFKKFG